MTLDEFQTYSAYLLAAWAIYGLGSVLISGSERSIFGAMGENLSYSLRIELITGVVYKQISWFDREDRAPGILTGVFSENIIELNGMTSEVVVTIVEVCCSMAFGIIGGFIICWQ